MSWIEDLFDDGTYDVEYAKMLRDEERAAREADFIARELALTESSRILDLACGHGRHALALAPQVGAVVGFDRTARFLEYARAKAAERGVANAEFVRGDMRELDYDAEFDAAYNYFTAWGYYSDEENQDVLARACRALRPGGRFLLEFIARDALMRRFRPRLWGELEDGTITCHEHRFDPGTGRMHNTRVYIRPDGSRKRIEIDHRIPAPEEFGRMFAEAGFTEARILSATDGGELTIDSPRMAVIGTRPPTERRERCEPC